MFVSSRRRHTRLQGDWSSDVCSSDLFPSIDMWKNTVLGIVWEMLHHRHGGALLLVRGDSWRESIKDGPCDRSEERRVGKEGRYRWLEYLYSKVNWLEGVSVIV